jgi:hypothetical protein
MEKLLQQIRDNQRFENWCCFPNNSIKYIYKENRLDSIIYYRGDIAQFAIYKMYNENGNLIEDRHITIIYEKDGTDNI